MLNLGAGIQLRLMLLWSSFKWLFIILAALIGVTLIVYFFYPAFTNHEHLNTTTALAADTNTKTEITESITSAMESGDYDVAAKELELALSRSPNNNVLRKIHSQLMDELKIEFKFNYLPDRRKELVSKENSIPVLTAKDPYYLSMSISGESYIYLFQLQSSGELIQLFPNKDFVPHTNPLSGGSLRIPDGYDWLYLDNIPGMETIYLVASRWRQNEIEELISRLPVAKEKEKIKIKELIIKRLLLEQRSADKLPGLVFAEHRFKHGISS